MAWEDVFGEIWFWAAASVIWARTALSAYGAPRSLIADAMKEPAAARFARTIVLFRIGAAGRWAPYRWPFLGAAAAYGVSSAVTGDALGPALVLAFAPIAAATLALEPQVRQGAETDDPTAFADALEQAWRLRFAATCVAIALTVVAATLWPR